jgi:hypothetical protein
MLLMVCAGGMHVAAAQDAHSAIVGVNVANAQRLSSGEQSNLIAQLHSNGVKVIRAGLVTPVEASLAFLTRAAAGGLHIQLVLMAANPASVASGAVKRRGNGLTWDYYPISSVDPAKFRAFVSSELNALAERKIPLVGLEFDNEINSAPFNGDFPVPGRGKVMDLADLSTDPVGQRVAKSYDAYLRLLGILKEVRDRSSAYRSTPIVSAGLANAFPPGVHPGVQMDSVTLNATLEYLRGHGLDRLVDGYGVHTYFTPGESAEARFRRLNRVLGDCAVGAGGKPCWLTEWGVRNPQPGCDADDHQRAAEAAQTLQHLDPAIRDGRVKALFYYEWDGNDPLGIYRCGHLMETGRVVLGQQQHLR